MSCFINNRKNNWQRFEDLLSLAEATFSRGLSKVEAASSINHTAASWFST
jgi:hypothetical protein